MAVGLLFLPVGLFATAKVGLASIDLLLGRSVEGSFLLGVVVALAFTALGALSIWTFFVPGSELVFDGSAKLLTSKRYYPFGKIRTEVFDLSDVAPPEAVWCKDAERIDDGFWALQVTLPTGRTVMHAPNAHSTSGQKTAVETLRESILRLSA